MLAINAKARLPYKHQFYICIWSFNVTLVLINSRFVQYILLIFLPYIAAKKSSFYTGFSKYGISELLRHEKIPETHVLAILLTVNAWL